MYRSRRERFPAARQRKKARFNLPRKVEPCFFSLSGFLLVLIIFGILIHMEKEFEEFLHKEIDPLAEENIPEWKLSRLFREGEFDEYSHFKELVFAVKGQKEKHEIMDELHEKLRAIDAGKAVTGFTEGHTRTVRNWDTESGMGYLTARDGTLFPVTAGELITDGAWGVSYKLDADVPREVKRDFVMTEAKRRISEILDDEIEHKKKASVRNYEFDNLNTKNDDGSFHAGVNGLAAEKFVETFFEKNIEDSNLPFKVEKADFYEDNTDKIDLVVDVLDYFRGIKVKGVKRKKIGVQLTTGRSGSKKSQIESAKKHLKYSTVHVDDIVLVKLPIKNCIDLYEKWKALGRLPGGPTKLWNTEQKEIVFRGVLNGLLSSEKINEMWETIEGKRPKTVKPDSEYVEKMQASEGEDEENQRKINALIQKIDKNFEVAPNINKPKEDARSENYFRRILRSGVRPDDDSETKTEAGETDSSSEEIKAASKEEAYDKMSPRIKSLLSVLNPSEKTKKKIEVEKQHLEQGLKDLLKNLNPSEKTKRKIEEKKQQLELVMRAFLRRNPVNEAENDGKSDGERISALKQEIENVAENQSGRPLTEKEKTIKTPKQELERKAQELLRKTTNKNGPVKIYAPEEIAEYQKGKTKSGDAHTHNYISTRKLK
jgi:hypothetical protein